MAGSFATISPDFRRRLVVMLKEPVPGRVKTRLGREIGLDSVEFQDSGETASTALVVGKQLSPRLFVSYGIGLFEAINTLRLRYRVNSRLTLETQSGAVTSADLLYSLER